MESMRGFDIFMRVAKKLCDRRRDVIFLIAGEDRICYGGDAKVTGGKSFKQWVLAQDNYDLSRFVFLGLVPPPVLAQLFNITDLHIYLTVPFVLSWSLFDALACGTTVLASDTAPVREIIEDGKNGLLVDFFDVNKIAEKANQVLMRPATSNTSVLPAPNSSAPLQPRCLLAQDAKTVRNNLGPSSVTAPLAMIPTSVPSQQCSVESNHESKPSGMVPFQMVASQVGAGKRLCAGPGGNGSGRISRCLKPG